MFSFRKRGQQADIHKVVRRLIDTSTPNFPPSTGNVRWENRSNRSLPVLLVPYDGAEVGDETAHAITKDLSSQGLALVLPHPLRAERVVVGFWSGENTHFVSGFVRQNVPLGGGFWQLGVELTELLPLAEHAELRRLLPQAARLDPQVNLAALNASHLVGSL
jgi:hypothetical protein